eukprot:gb/GFBE01057040.1/.p1 GENE.gb/GFBE01057040.1/~~gb/GFBE01057040.1/.p1  ORF type:complete len:332 (+),score=60.39 gb/GFBE01057040.1/:1-996(+)
MGDSRRCAVADIVAVAQRPTTAEFLWPYLSLFDLPRLQLACRRLQTVLVGPGPWQTCLGKEQPKLRLSPELLEPGCRSQCLKAMPGIYRATLSGATVEIKSLEEVRGLTKQLETAERTAASHFAGGGKTAHIVVARPRFSGHMLETALDKILPGRKAGGYKAMCFASPFRCPPVPPDTPPPPGSSESTVTAVSIQLVWRTGALLIGAWEDDASSAEEDISDEDEEDEGDDDSTDDTMPVFRLLSVDVLSASPDLLLHYRSINITLNGPLNKAQSGVYNPTRGRDAAIQALSDGLLCVVCLKDRLAKRQGTDFLTNSLNFDSMKPWQHMPGM